MLPPDVDPRRLAETLTGLGGPAAIEAVLSLAELLRREGHHDAAELWSAVAQIMRTVATAP